MIKRNRAGSFLMTGLLIAVLTGCASLSGPEHIQPEQSTETASIPEETQLYPEESVQPEETTTEERIATEPADAGNSAMENTADSAEYSLISGTVAEYDPDAGVFLLKTKSGALPLKCEQIGDLETDLEEGSRIVIGCVGTVTQEMFDAADVSALKLVVALPGDPDWELQETNGTFVDSAMSTFSIQLADETQWGFMKDGCPVEDGAFEPDSAKTLHVVYLEANEMRFPLNVTIVKEK